MGVTIVVSFVIASLLCVAISLCIPSTINLQTAAHHSWQDWHRKVDDALRDFIVLRSPTMSEFIDKLEEVYTPLVERFPTVLDVLNRIK